MPIELQKIRGGIFFKNLCVKEYGQTVENIF